MPAVAFVQPEVDDRWGSRFAGLSQLEGIAVLISHYPYDELGKRFRCGIPNDMALTVR